ncbi:MAG: TRAP transporter large permease subunit [Geminicoccaceae bacterium]
MPIAFAMAAVGGTLGILIAPSAVLITPPVGMNVFVLRGVLRDVPLTTIFRGVLPFWVADIFRLPLLIVVPGLSLWLVSVM